MKTIMKPYTFRNSDPVAILFSWSSPTELVILVAYQKVQRCGSCLFFHGRVCTGFTYEFDGTKEESMSIYEGPCGVVEPKRIYQYVEAENYLPTS